MNAVNRVELNLAKMPLNVCENIFEHLSEDCVFEIFAKVNKACAESVKNYSKYSEYVESKYVEKVLICVIGQEKFKEIPVWAESAHLKINCLMTRYLTDSNLPSIIRGSNEKGLKFLFLRLNFKENGETIKKTPCYFFISSQNIFNKEPRNRYNYCIYSESYNPFASFNQVDNRCIKILQGLFKDGFYTYRNEVRRLEIDTKVKYE